jgi:hypothetical protein
MPSKPCWEKVILVRFLVMNKLKLSLKVINEVLPDRFGIPVQPREWFFVPLETIEAVIEKIKEGTLDQFQYDPETLSLRRS